MVGIGEASAVIGVVQVGFSLARTLNTYIGDYKDSRDSIISLAAELDATIIQVKELNALVADNKASNSLGEGSKKLAEKCVKDSERLIKRLVELLTKAHLPEDPDAIVSIKPGDIIVGKLTRAYWPLIKPQVDVVKSELHVMKTDILLARSCIQSHSGGTPAVRAADGENIVALAKSRQLARKLLREAKAEEKRSVSAMQNPDPYSVPGGGRSNPFSPYQWPPRRSTRLDPSESRRPYVSMDDGRDTELMAQDLREAILEELKRKEDERKAKLKAEEEAQQLAIDSYQKTVREKLARLQASSEATQNQMEKIFGPTLDKEQMKKFLDEQRSREMQDEFGKTLMQFGIAQQLPSSNSMNDGTISLGENGTRTPKRRWFFKRHSSRSSDSTASLHHANMAASHLSSQNPTQFLHIVLSFDPAEGRYNYQPFDNPALKHQPCGPSCDFESTMRAWQGIPRSIKQSASRWVDDNYSDRIWHLHAALPFARDARRTRKFLQKAILGEALHQGTSSILLIFSSNEKYTGSQADNSTAEDAKSVSSHASVPNSTGAASRVELSQVDIEQMRDWLIAKGLSTAKIAELESMVVKQKETATAPAEPQASAEGRTSVEERRPQADSVTPHGFREPSTTVRFVDDATALKSKDWATLASAAPAAPGLSRLASRRRSKVDKSTHKKDEFLFRPETYNNRVSYRIHRGHSPLRRGYSYDNQSGERERTYDIERAGAPERSSRLDDEREYERRLHEDHYTKEIAALNNERDELRRRRDLYENDLFEYQEQYRRDQERPTRIERSEPYSRRARTSRRSPSPPRPTPYYIYERRYSSVPKDSGSKFEKAAEAKFYDREGDMAYNRIAQRPKYSSRHRSRSRGRMDPDVVQVIEREPIRRSSSSSISPSVSGEAYPTRRSTFDQWSPVPREREEIIIRRRGSRSRHDTNDYPSYDADTSRAARQASKNDEWAFPPRHAATNPYVYSDITYFPRASSPEELQEDISDAEDAMLGDAELTNKMMIKYTGGTMLSAATDSTGEATNTEQVQPTRASHRERVAPMLADLGIKRQNTATVEDEAEDENGLHNSLADKVIDRDSRGRDNSTNNEGRPQSFDWGFVSPSTAKKTRKNSHSAHTSEARAHTTEKPENNTTAGGDENDEWGSFGQAARKKKKRAAEEVLEPQADTSVPSNHRNGGSHSITSASSATKSESSRSRSRTRARTGRDNDSDAKSIELARPNHDDTDLYD